MPFLTPEDLNTHMYAEVVSDITRGDDSIVQKAMNAAVAEASLYLTRFDTVALFGDETSSPRAIDVLLERIVKDITVWNIIRLGNPSVDYNAAKTAWESAIATLEKLKTGELQPSNWPYKESATSNLPHGDAIYWASNPKRDNYF